MNYNYVMTTGVSGISGSMYQIDERNNLGSVGIRYTVDYAIISGSNISNVSLNSQTLFEGVPLYYTGTNLVNIKIDSGDYYFDNSKQDNYGVVFLDESLPVNGSGFFIYDKTKKTTGVLGLHTGGAPTGTLEVITDDLIARGELGGGASFKTDLFTGWDIYANGQKTASYEEFTGINTDITGRFFAIKKKPNIYEYNSGIEDSFGQKFIDHQVDFYINGTEQPDSLFVLTYTGVNLLVTGEQAVASIYQTESNNYNL